MMAMTVFSLNPAFTNRITDALVSGVSDDWAEATETKLRSSSKKRSSRKRKQKDVLVGNALCCCCGLFLFQQIITALFASTCVGTCRGCGRRLWFSRLALVSIADSFDVVSGFAIRRNSVAKPDHSSFARVVTCQYQIDSIVESI